MDNREKKTTLLGHLKDLRRVLMISLAAIVIGVLGCYFFLREPLMAIAFGPIRQLGKDAVMIGVGEGFIVQMKVACIAGITIASPAVLWQAFTFVLPALYQHEKKAFILCFFAAVVMFFAGILFAYLYVLDFGLRTFLLDYAGGMTTMISASKYLSFLETFLLPFGLIFQIPLVTGFLTKIGILTPDKLKRKRRYAILIILIVAAFLTPPDILSQIMLSVPMFALYEVSILFSKYIVKKKEAKQKAEYQLAKKIYHLE